MRRAKILAAAIGVSTLAVKASAQTTVLYNGALGTSPDSQPWLAYASSPAGASVTTTSTGTTLDTTSSLAFDAGYSDYTLLPPGVKNSSFPALSSTTGFSFNFTVRVNSESHTGANGANRAGFDVIALDKNDNGIELGFWGNDNEVWAQGTTPTLFTKAETATFNSESAFHNYSLTVQGGTYTLSADGTTILTGAERNYSAYPNPVYSLPNFVFLGDDTTDAAGSETINAISITVPEPMTGVLFGLAGIIGLSRRARRKISR